MRRVVSERKIVMFILIGAVALFAFSGIVMLLWNNVLVAVTHVSPVSIWQAMGILVLSKILFGAFRGGGWGPRRYWKNKMMRNWNEMTPEEREKFKQQWQQRCGHWKYKSWNEEEQAKEQQNPL